ncbi:hypothetical protein HPB50_023260 [Hyalomma asiaticum]|uniref:Uncharacterized protein n=1 Tax=Hyalomma asiaticum TaxID=266040 RepID=A0ACB7SBW0_HYAAI|nr:hypothetical protein HPB50_023260 [Hyalomma asiaticum]
MGASSSPPARKERKAASALGKQGDIFVVGGGRRLLRSNRDHAAAAGAENIFAHVFRIYEHTDISISATGERTRKKGNAFVRRSEEDNTSGTPTRQPGKSDGYAEVRERARRLGDHRRMRNEALRKRRLRNARVRARAFHLSPALYTSRHAGGFENEHPGPEWALGRGAANAGAPSLPDKLRRAPFARLGL